METGGNATAKIVDLLRFETNRTPAQIQNRQYPTLAAVAIAEIMINI